MVAEEQHLRQAVALLEREDGRLDAPQQVRRVLAPLPLRVRPLARLHLRARARLRLARALGLARLALRRLAGARLREHHAEAAHRDPAADAVQDRG